MSYTIIQGDNRETLKTIPDNSIDSIVTDPPYGISFLGKDWDSFRNSKVTKNSTVKNLGSGMRMTTKDENVNFQLWCEEWARECFRVLKPGGYMLSFCAARMYHRMTVGLEDAGFEIRDQIMWIYSSGFPKSQDVGKSIQRKNKNEEPNDWLGWGTSLKPAHEPIALARKPIKQSIKDNCLKYGTGALNIDATRIPTDDVIICGAGNDKTFNKFNAENNVDGPGTGVKVNKDVPKWQQAEAGRFPSNVLGDIPDYQKYFYCPKVSRKERHIGYDLNKVPTIEHNDPATIHLHPLWTPAIGKNVYRLKQAIEEHNNKVPPTNPDGMMSRDELGQLVNNYTAKKAAVGNNHPTVKPIELMKYLIKLITPPGGTVLDPFNGSGSTGCAAVELGHNYIGCELDPAYVDIANRRIAAWLVKDQPIVSETFANLFEEQ